MDGDDSAAATLAQPAVKGSKKRKTRVPEKATPEADLAEEKAKRRRKSKEKRRKAKENVDSEPPVGGGDGGQEAVVVAVAEIVEKKEKKKKDKGKGKGKMEPKAADLGVMGSKKDLYWLVPGATVDKYGDIDPFEQTAQLRLRMAQRMVGEATARVLRGLYMDPPWGDYKNIEGQLGCINGRYELLTVREMMTMPIREVLRPAGGILLMWFTSPMFYEAHRLWRKWGFSIAGVLTWVKTYKGNRNICKGAGHYMRPNAEYLAILIPTVAGITMRLPHPYSVIVAPRRGHSEKPEQVRAWIENTVGVTPLGEMFSRRKRHGWQCTGNQLPDQHNLVDYVRGADQTNELFDRQKRNAAELEWMDGFPTKSSFAVKGMGEGWVSVYPLHLVREVAIGEIVTSDPVVAFGAENRHYSMVNVTPPWTHCPAHNATILASLYALPLGAILRQNTLVMVHAPLEVAHSMEPLWRRWDVEFRTVGFSCVETQVRGAVEGKYKSPRAVPGRTTFALLGVRGAFTQYRVGYGVSSVLETTGNDATDSARVREGLVEAYGDLPKLQIWGESGEEVEESTIDGSWDYWLPGYKVSDRGRCGAATAGQDRLAASIEAWQNTSKKDRTTEIPKSADPIDWCGTCGRCTPE
jgi:N6-adenosine-specific RNA methylase IME4